MKFSNDKFNNERGYLPHADKVKNLQRDKVDFFIESRNDDIARWDSAAEGIAFTSDEAIIYCHIMDVDLLTHVDAMVNKVNEVQPTQAQNG